MFSFITFHVQCRPTWIIFFYEVWSTCNSLVQLHSLFLYFSLMKAKEENRKIVKGKKGRNQGTNQRKKATKNEKNEKEKKTASLFSLIFPNFFRKQFVVQNQNLQGPNNTYQFNLLGLPSFFCFLSSFFSFLNVENETNITYQFNLLGLL